MRVRCPLRVVGLAATDEQAQRPLDDVVVAVELQPETTATFTTRPVSVTGTFRIREFRGYNDELALIYWLEDAVVEGAP